MYHINRAVDKPDIDYMHRKVDELMLRGIRLADCNKLLEYYTGLREDLKNDLNQRYGIVNPNSTQQVAAFIEQMSNKVELNSKNDIINICYDSDKGKWTSRAEALEKLADLGYDFAQDLLDYRHAKKYAESIEGVVSAADSEGLIHPGVSLGKTHRINYREPGLLTIPKKLLWHIIAPYTPGNVLYSVDIKNQEPSILINMTGAEELKYALESEEGLYETMFRQCFRQYAQANILIDTLPENRIYSMEELKHIGTISPATYSPIKPSIRDVYFNGKRVVGIETICAGSEKGLMPTLPDTVELELEDGSVVNTGVTWESAEKKYKKNNDYTLNGELDGIEIKIGKAERKEFKTAWLAISYGASIFGIKMSCKTIDGTRVYNYITKINELKEYRSAIDKKARALDNGIRTIFGTPMYAGEEEDYKKLKRILLDLPVQGSGADILSLLIKHFYDYTKEKGIDDKLSIYYTRHDELIIEVDKGYLDSVGEESVENTLRDMLEHQVDDWTPFKIEVVQTQAESLGLDLDDED